MAKRRRRVGEQRMRRERELIARRAQEQAEEDQLRRRCAELEATIIAAPELSDELLDPNTHVRADAALARFEQRSAAQLAAASAKFRTATVADRQLAAAAEILARELTSAELALDQAVERIRSGDRSRKYIAALARAITAELAAVENDATADAAARAERLRSLGVILLEIASS